MTRTMMSTLALVAATPALAQTADVNTADPNTADPNTADPNTADPNTSATKTAEPSGENRDVVVTASRVVTAAREIGSAITVITDADLKRGQITFVKDALQDVPGVRVSSDRPGDFTNVYIRGSNNDEVLWLIDGIELGDPSAISTQFSADNLTTRDIARIEVLRGNQSSLYGSDAIGGVINIITQRATEDGYTVNAEAEAGSYGELNGGASVLGKSGPVDFRLTASGYRHTGPSLADPATASPPGSASEDDDYRRYGFSGRVGVAATDTLTLQALGFWQDVRTDLDNTTSDSADTLRKKEWALGAQANYLSTDGKWKADVIASRYFARKLYFGVYNAADGDVYRGTKDEATVNLAYGGAGPVALAVGGNYERERTRQETLYGGTLLAKVDTRSAYAELALRPLTGLTLTGAGRIDDNSRFGTFDTYRGTIAYVAGPVKVRASYGTGAKAPGLYQLFDPTYGNPDLKPEKSRGGDVGVDVAIVPGMTAEITYFFNQKTNEINFDGSRPPFGGYGQFGRTRAKGIELGVAVTPAPWVSASQTYAYTDHEVDDAMAGVYVDSGRPKSVATTTLTVRPVPRAELTGRMRYHDRDASGYGGVTAAYTVVDLLGSYAITDRLELYGRVVNLFDRQYQVSYGTDTLGLSAYGGVRVSF